MKKITVVHAQSVIAYPPVISLIENLLNNGSKATLISYDIDLLPTYIQTNSNFRGIQIPKISGNFVGKVRNSFKRSRFVKAAVKKSMVDSDLLWTTTDLSVRVLGDDVLKYKHVMQLMELIKWYPDNFYLKKIAKLGIFRYPLDKYARKAWKVVVPEENRAYIQQLWWNLPDKPQVLPNKPYELENSLSQNNTPSLNAAINKMKKEKRKIVLYLGILSPERGLASFARAINNLGKEYCLYIIGKPINDSYLQKIKYLTKKYNNVIYLGYYPAPLHLLFLRFAHIGLLPYQPSKPSVEFISELNALYCAPNKIFEYAGYGLPMLGTNVPGIEYPIRKYGIGATVNHITDQEIVFGINLIEKNYEVLSKNCLKYYNDVDLDNIVNKIIN